VWSSRMRALNGGLRRVAFTRSASYAGVMFQGKINPTELFPFPTSSLPDHVKDSMNESRANLSAAAGDSWGILVPEHFGGLGLPHPCAFEVACRAPASIYSSLHFHTMLAYAMRSFADKEHAGRYLSQMSDGSVRVGWAVDEFRGPNDFCTGGTTATANASDATYSLSGEKAFYGTSPNAFAVFCRVSGEVPKHIWIYVDAATKGVSVSGNTVRFDSVVVPVDNVFVAAGDAYKAVMTTVLTSQYMVAGAAANLAQDGCHDDAVKLQIASWSYALETCGAAVAANIEKGVSDTFIETTLLSLLTTRVLALVRQTQNSEVAHVEKLLGGVHSFAKGAACCGIEDFAIAFNGTSTMETMQLRTLRTMGFIDKFPSLDLDSTVVQRCEKLIVKLGEFVEKIAVRHGTVTSEREMLLQRTSQSAALLFATSAVLSRAHRAVNGKVATCQTEASLATVWAASALDSVETLLQAAGSTAGSADSAHARIASELLAR
jgi:hypothetical protein